MKKMIALTLLVSSIMAANVQAAAIAGSYLATTVAYGSIYTSEHNKLELVAADAQAYLQTGELSLALEQAIRDIQAIHPEMSADEVVDGLLMESGTIIAN